MSTYRGRMLVHHPPYNAGEIPFFTAGVLLVLVDQNIATAVDTPPATTPHQPKSSTRHMVRAALQSEPITNEVQRGDVANEVGLQ